MSLSIVKTKKGDVPIAYISSKDESGQKTKTYVYVNQERKLKS